MTRPSIMSPRTPTTECRIEDLLVQMQQRLLAEMASMNTKLDHMAAQVGVTLPSTAPQQKCAFQLDRQSEPSTVCAESTRQARLRRARSKIWALGAILAAGKRRGRIGESVGISNFSKPSDDDPVRAPSVAASMASMATIASKPSRFMPEMFDSEAARRLRHIQKALRQQEKMKGCRFKLWQLTHSIHSSRPAFIYACILKLIVVASVLTAFLNASSAGSWDVVEIVLESLFAFEFSLRLACCPHALDFLLGFFNLLDLVSALPVVFRLTGLLQTNDAMLSVVPFLRLLKLMRWFEKLQLLLQAFKRALEALPSLLFTMAVIALFFAEVLYLVEPIESIQSLPYALWFTIVTMTTVGYGDYTPTTTVGRSVASVLIIISALYMAMPLGIVGNAFSEVWADRDRLLVMKRFRGAFLQGGFTLQGLHDVFAIFDADGNGTLDIDEFAQMLRTIQMKLSEERIGMLFQALDKEKTGEIQFDELLAALVPKSFVRTKFQFSSVSKILGTWSLSPTRHAAVENV